MTTTTIAAPAMSFRSAAEEEDAFKKFLYSPQVVEAIKAYELWGKKLNRQDEEEEEGAAGEENSLTRATASPLDGGPSFVSFAPGRINLIGEHVDYMGGCVLPAAVTQGCTVVVGPTSGRSGGALPGKLLFHSTAAGLPDVAVDVGAALTACRQQRLANSSGTTSEEDFAATLIQAALVDLDGPSPSSSSTSTGGGGSWGIYPAGAVLETLLHDIVTPENASNTDRTTSAADAPFYSPPVDADRVVRVLVHSTIPMGAGMSSSAGLCVALIYAVGHALGGADADGSDVESPLFVFPSKVEVAKRARTMEVKYKKVNIGIMDQFASVFAVPGCVLHLNCDTLEYREVDAPFASVGGRWLLVSSMVNHSLGGAYNAIRRDMEDGQRVVAEAEAREGRVCPTLVQWAISHAPTTGGGCSSADAADEALAAFRQRYNALLLQGQASTTGPHETAGGEEGEAAKDDSCQGRMQMQRSSYVVGEVLRTQAFIATLGEILPNGSEAASGRSRKEEEEGLRTIGRLLSETHAGLRDALGVSTPEIELIYATAMSQPGCYGGRLMGGGFGGCVLLLLKDDSSVETRIVAAVRSEFQSRFQLDPEVIPVQLGGGACHVRLLQ